MNNNLKATFWGWAPFVGAAALAWALVPVGSRVDWLQYGASCALALVAGVLTLQITRGDRRAQYGIVPSGLVFLGAVALLRNSVGGIASGTSALAIIPVFHTALYSRSRRDLTLILAGVAVFYIAPILLFGPPAYPHTQYRSALLAVSVDAIIGFATQRLVARVRRQASQASDREQTLERLGDVVHGLFDSLQPRRDICEAAKSIGAAAVALIYEPSPTTNSDLCCTAMTEIDGDVTPAPAARQSAVHEVFRSGRPKLVTADLKASVGDVGLWIACGRPRSVLFQPLMREGVALGVLIVGWTEREPAAGARSTVTLLAHEAAAVIARADVMDHLAGEAQTDPLTGLPNRRAWDAELQHALAADGQPAIAMLDFDHFKEFNDTYGHPAGDRLLKETAAAWRDELRAGDILARLGGEEFGLLLRESDADTAIEVTERLRRRVSHNRTCSAGITIAAPRESAETAVARADAALYEAKARGRDRIHVTTAV